MMSELCFFRIITLVRPLMVIKSPLLSSIRSSSSSFLLKQTNKLPKTNKCGKIGVDKLEIYELCLYSLAFDDMSKDCFTIAYHFTQNEVIVLQGMKMFDLMSLCFLMLSMYVCINTRIKGIVRLKISQISIIFT